MRRRLHSTAVIAGLIALVGAVVIPAAAQAAVPETVTSVDFEDGTLGDWSASGEAELTVVDDDTKVLEVAGRAADYEGIQTATGIFEPGATYEFTMRAKLDDAVTESTGIRFVMKPAYTWIGNTTIDGAGWTQVTGSIVVPADANASELQAYIGTDDIAGLDDFTYYLDDIVVTKTADAPECVPDVVPVASIDFEDGTTGDWSASGGAALAVIDDDTKVLEIAGRAADYEGLQSPAAYLTPGTTYHLSMRVKLGADATEAAGVRFVVKPAYTWVGNTTVDSSGWATVSGTYTVPDDAVAADLQVYIGTDDIEGIADYTYYVDDIVVTANGDNCDDGGGPDGPAPGTVLLANDFESDLGGWGARDNGEGAPTVSLSTAYAHGGSQSAAVTDRVSQGSGMGIDVTELLTPGAPVELTAWVRFGEGQATDDVWLSMQRTTDGSDSFDTLAQFTGVTNSGWTQVTARFTPAAFDTALLYFETAYSGTNTSDLYFDDITLQVPDPVVIEDLPPIKDNVPFPIGVAIDSRETTGAAAELVQRHFGQVTPENYMKPEAWYDDEGNWAPNAGEINAVMDFARANDLTVYGHVLVWHSQTPEFFFQHEDGTPLTSDPADQELLRQRMRDHIFNVAQYLSDEYGLFGSETNPLIAFDVVNEVISDSGEYADGLRRSDWYAILGEQFIDDAFAYADEAFNDVYADAAADRPVTLFINDYNTEQAGKRARYHDLVERLLDRGAPVDGVGHQFHLNLAYPVENVEAALTDFEDLPVIQAVTEFDVPTGTPESEAKFIDQGYYYKQAFDIFRAHADDLYSVTVWGLYDARSWRDDNGGPLVFDDDLQAKPAYYGIVDGDLPAPLRSANVFAGDVPLDGDAVGSPVWERLPLIEFEGGSFQTRWASDHLTVYVETDDATASAGDAVQFQVGEAVYTVNRDGSGDVAAEAEETEDGYVVVAHLPLADAAQGDTLSFDVAVLSEGASSGWNTEGVLGTLTLIEELSFVEVEEATEAPAIDASIDDVWEDANAVTTDKQVSGTDGAIATVRTLWKDDTLYVLAEVADPTVDLTGSDPWTQDSVEIFVDAGNAKAGSYRPDDTQIRINAENVVSFGTGDEAIQASRLESATALVEGGYVVEAAISLLEYGGEGTFHGLDFQVNDATDGERTSIRNWADPTGLGYQSTAHWGVGELVAAEVEPPTCGPGKPCPPPCKWGWFPGKACWPHDGGWGHGGGWGGWGHGWGHGGGWSGHGFGWFKPWYSPMKHHSFGSGGWWR
ncbi:endo-1,4-beta-xylanase [Demequina sp. TTPB684]|uniref:endo-1,4-beta-xylanase n=1 Tax=unclassified Demequina TaxID=2620311 RepID=UPI001CF5C9EC|nr:MULTISPECIES: endo-1,4-beta-xylanase [unclassified Demequina]MCB2413345.1 endo-1,4-beta-xylanase [Demequina sp. TTPB684]UPU87483.1 endo-1,4-beta-xylanase [Demequina sp. TMPB413]